MDNETRWRRIYEYFAQRWVLTTVISTIPAWWFTFVDLLGENAGLKIAGKLTPTAYYVLLFSFALSFAFNLLLALATSYDNVAKKSGQRFLNIVLENINSIKHAKLKRFIKYINENKTKLPVSPFYEITQPQAQIDVILENMRLALSQITQIGLDGISVSVIYNSDINPHWNWLANVNIDTDLELEELLSNPRTAVNQVIQGHDALVFFPDKNVGVAEGKYVMGRKDHAYNRVGSIICKDISLETNEKCIRAILSISTYGLQLCAENDTDARSKIATKVLPAFERRIQLELALFYIKEIMTKPPVKKSRFQKSK